MVEIIEIVPPGSQHWWIIWVGAIALITVSVILAIAIQESEVVGAGVLLAVVWAFFWALGMSFTDVANHKDAKAEALEKSGYSQVEMDVNKFTAVKGGERVKGILEPVQNSDNQYQVLIIPAVP